MFYYLLGILYRTWVHFCWWQCFTSHSTLAMRHARYAPLNIVLLLQALPLVSTIWGVVLFGEYFRSSKRTYILLVSFKLTISSPEISSIPVHHIP